MKKTKRLLATILALLMLAAVLSACKKDPPAPPAPAPSAAQPSQAAPAPAPADPTGADVLAQLLAMPDRIPLAGLQPPKLDSRAHIDKALPFVAKRDPILIGWCSATQGMTFFTEMVRSAQETADKYGYNFTFQVANFDVNAQMTQIENFLTQNVDFLVVNAVDIDATASYYQEAVEKGIPVICVGPTGGQPQYPVITTIVSGSFEAGYVVGIYTAQKLYEEFKDKPLQYATLMSRVGDSDSESRNCGFISGYIFEHARLAGSPYPNKWAAVMEGYNFWKSVRDKGSGTYQNVIGVLGWASASSTESTAGQPFAADLLTAHPDMDLFFIETATLEPGVMAEIEHHNMVAGTDLYVACGADGENWTLANIKKGLILATGVNVPYYTGEGVVELIHKIVDEGFDANNLPATSYTPTYCINVDNIDEFYTDPEALFAPMQPWDIQTIDQYNALMGG